MISAPRSINTITRSVSKPKYIVGIKLLVIITLKPRKIVNDVYYIAYPMLACATLMLSKTLFVSISSLNRWM